MQKAEVARPSETFGQHILQDQPEEILAGHGSVFHPPGLGVAIAEAHLAVITGDDVFLADHTPVKIASQIDEAGSPLPTDLQSTTQSFGERRAVSLRRLRWPPALARKTLASALWLNR